MYNYPPNHSLLKQTILYGMDNVLCIAIGIIVICNFYIMFIEYTVYYES